MAYTGSVDFSLIDGINQNYNAKVKNVSAVDKGAESFEDTLANVNDNSDDVAKMSADKKNDGSELKAAELAGNGNNRKEALNAVAKKEFDNSDMEQMSDEMAGLMQELINSIMQMLEEKLGMTAEELQAALGELGITEVDLLNAGNLTQFVVDVKADGNLNELLVNEDLHMAVTELTDALEAAADDISEELGKEFEQIKTEFSDYTEAVGTEMAKTEVKIATTENNGKFDMNDETGNNRASDNAVYNGAGMFNEVVNNIAQNASEVSNTQITADIVNQVIEQVKVRITEDVTSMELQLTPESLGKINLQVSAKDGVVTAQITTETLIAKEAVESQVALLKENLNEQGVKVEAVEVTVAPHQFEARDEEQREKSNEEQQTSRRRFIDVNGDEEEQFDEAAAIARDIMMSGGNRMDIRA